MLFPVIVVPELCRHEYFLALDETFVNCPLDALTCFLLILIVVRTIKKTVAGSNRLLIFSNLFMRGANV